MKFLKERVRAGGPLWGTFVNLGSPLTAEIIGQTGYDWVILDLEHGSGDERDTLPQMQALEHTAAVPLVRIEINHRPRAHRVLDFGAAGVMVPRVDTAEQARDAVASMRYAPAGQRGIALMNRACGFGARTAAYFAAANEQLLTIVQIESTDAVEQAGAIAAVDGVDVLFVGPADLSQSMGIFGQYHDPGFLEAVRRTGAAAKTHGKAAGVLLPSLADLRLYWEAGYRFIGAGSDSAFVRIGAATQLQNLRSSIEAGSAGR